ncbi:MAG: alpha-2-macroglobulin family protein [Chitinophagales bacterium]
MNETAFFYPELHTDAEGNIVFEFTIPEALTTWNFMAFAHDKEMRSGQLLSSVITQKELMIQPNMPRFLRAGDTIDVRAKISNLTENVLDGSAYLELYNALNMERVDAAFALQKTAVSFHTDAKGNAAVEWHIIVPEGYEALLYKVKAKAGDFTDGEENALPVLTNRILITEALPLWVRGQKQSDFQFTHLLQSDAEKGIVNRQLSLEYTSNPAWYAVQALPYMMEYPYECAEQLFNRFYSNAIGYYITQSNPNIKRTFDQWKNDPEALTSNLEKNEDLKSLLLQETPWVLQAQDESARKKRVALLFDENTMNNSLQSAMQKLSAMQLPDGGFPWFKGYESDRYITQYIMTGIAHLKSLGIGASDYPKMNSILDRSIVFCDEKMKEDYKWLEKNNVDKKTYVPGNITVQYLYARSYFKEYALDLKYKEAYDYYLGRIKSEWKKYGLYEQGMIALIMQRTGNTSTANDIVKSLKEYSQRSDEMGMWWKNNTAGYYWNQAPVETQALMIEVFDEVAHDAAAVEDLQVWLLRQKQTGDWKTTRATAEACYALLAWGEDLLDNNQLAAITLGGMLVQPEDTEAGTGYFRMNWMGGDVHANMGNVSITPPEKNTLSYGALYWQYFQDLDKVKRSGNDIQIQKELYLTKNTATGPELIAINEKTPLHVGDLVTVRMIITSDRKLEYVHLKDMRASLFEPVNVLSGYKWQGGLGYYEATGDAATNFFIAYMDKGTYVFEYPLRVAQTGNCSNGVASIQCMYAPEFVSYSEGRRVVVK